MPRIRTTFAFFTRNQDHPPPYKRFPSIKGLGALLDSERPLGESALKLEAMKLSTGGSRNVLKGRATGSDLLLLLFHVLLLGPSHGKSSTSK